MVNVSFKIDLNRACQHVAMNEDSRKSSIMTTEGGSYLMKYLPFGIASAPVIFQRVMDNTLKGIREVTCYQDQCCGVPTPDLE